MIVTRTSGIGGPGSVAEMKKSKGAVDWIVGRGSRWLERDGRTLKQKGWGETGVVRRAREHG